MQHVSGQMYKLFRHGIPWLFMYATAVVLSILDNTDKPILFFMNVFRASVTVINFRRLIFLIFSCRDHGPLVLKC